MRDINDCNQSISTEWICDRKREGKRKATRQKREQGRKPKEKGQDEYEKMKNQICER
jgi:hypothetical protein